MEGYVKLYRQLLESPVFDNEKVLKVWIYCLLRASHKEGEALIGNQVVKLKAGQFIYGVEKASEKLNIPKASLRRYMLSLANMGNISIKTNNKFSVVTVENWELFQVDELKVNNKRTTNEKQMNTNKNDKNDKNIIPPTLEMVTKYCIENNYPINPEQFINYYDSKGWLVGKSKMKDWQAAIRTWNNNARQREGVRVEQPRTIYEV